MRNAKDGARFSVRHFVVIGHRVRLAKYWLHFGKRTINPFEALLLCVGLFWIGRRSSNLLRPTNFIIRAAGFYVRPDDGHLLLSLEHQSGVYYDSRKPGLKV